MERALPAPGEARTVTSVLRELAARLGLADFYPWAGEEGVLDALIAHPSTGGATVTALRAEGGIRPLRISHVAHPDLRFPTPSGKLELYSERAAGLGLPPLPVYQPLPDSQYPLIFRQGRTLTQFHSFYDHGQVLPTLARLDPEPVLWMAPADGAARGVVDGSPIRLFNERGEMKARAHLTDKIPGGTVWMRDGWGGLNRLTAGVAAIPDEAVEVFGFSAGQASFDARVEVAPA
jgi:anaerobic selenocysteine-containing dehydrogenase